MGQQTHVMITSVKNEGPYLLEFIAHHRNLGFDRHHFASNDCEDGSDLLLDALAAHDIVTHMPNPLEPGDAPQPMAYRRIREQQDIDRNDWIMVLDVDEFLMINHGAGRIGDLTALAGEDIDLISLNSLSFGTSDDEKWRPGLVTRQFTHRLPTTSRHNAPLKSVTRGKGRWRGLHNHNPVGFQGGARPIRALLGSGEVIEIADTGRPTKHLRNRLPEEDSFDLAYYNHYRIKSLECYLQRAARGRGGIPNDDKTPRYTEHYWRSFAAARQEDERIVQRHGPMIEAEMARLLALPGVAEAHRNCEKRYRRLLDRMI